MGQTVIEDFYVLLGISRSADGVQLRRAYRKLALKHHPDTAGHAATAMFQRIAEAYRVLSDPETRASYDFDLRAWERSQRGGFVAGAPDDGRPQPGRSWRQVDRPADLIPRVSGRLDELVSRGAARRMAGGMVELLLTQPEAERGGTALFDVEVPVACPTCQGVAAPGRVWCMRCKFEGRVVDSLTVCLPIRAQIRDGTTFSVPVDTLDLAPSLRVRIRVRG